MQAFYKGKSADFWIVQKEGEQSEWVKKAFETNAFSWIDNHLRICMPLIFPKWASDAQNFGYNMYRRAEIGDVIDRTNGRVVTLKKFEKEYRVEKG